MGPALWVCICHIHQKEPYTTYVRLSGRLCGSVYALYNINSHIHHIQGSRASSVGLYAIICLICFAQRNQTKRKFRFPSPGKTRSSVPRLPPPTHPNTEPSAHPSNKNSPGLVSLSTPPTHPSASAFPQLAVARTRIGFLSPSTLVCNQHQGRIFPPSESLSPPSSTSPNGESASTGITILVSATSSSSTDPSVTWPKSSPAPFPATTVPHRNRRPSSATYSRKSAISGLCAAPSHRIPQHAAHHMACLAGCGAYHSFRFRFLSGPQFPSYSCGSRSSI